jgi:hypothetical protein
MQNAVFWDVKPCGCCSNRRFGGTSRLHHKCDRRQRATKCFRNVRSLLLTANVVPSSAILVTLMLEAICSSETLVVTRATQSHVPKDGIMHVRFKVFTAVTMKNAVFWDIRHVALVRTDVSNERITYIIKVTRMNELGTMLAVTSNRRDDASNTNHTANITEHGILRYSA